MYRAVTWRVLVEGEPIEDEATCGSLAMMTHLAFAPEGICVDGVLRELEIRSAEVDRAVSVVAAHPAVRAAIVPLQRGMAADAGGAVAEGRDVTTVVFPEADHRFFLSASPEVRARRRSLQRGPEEVFEDVLAEIKRRDHLDSTRADSPLMRGEGVSVIETGGLGAREVVELMLSIIHKT
jgi:cytidylate kinase